MRAALTSSARRMREGLRFRTPVQTMPGREYLRGLDEEVVYHEDVEEGYADALLTVLGTATEVSGGSCPDCELEIFPSRVFTMQIPSEDDVEEEKVLNKSDAHFTSEQALFTAANESDGLDITTFVDLGHPDECWCSNCDEPPELVMPDHNMS